MVTLGGDIKEDDLIFHDEKMAEPSLAFMLSRMRYPEFPEPMGVFRNVDAPVFEDMMQKQLEEVTAKQGKGDLDKLLHSGDTWVVE